MSSFIIEHAPHLNRFSVICSRVYLKKSAEEDLIEENASALLCGIESLSHRQELAQNFGFLV